MLSEIKQFMLKVLETQINENYGYIIMVLWCWWWWWWRRQLVVCMCVFHLFVFG